MEIYSIIDFSGDEIEEIVFYSQQEVIAFFITENFTWYYFAFRFIKRNLTVFDFEIKLLERFNLILPNGNVLGKKDLIDFIFEGIKDNKMRFILHR